MIRRTLYRLRACCEWNPFRLPRRRAEGPSIVCTLEYSTIVELPITGREQVHALLCSRRIYTTSTPPPPSLSFYRIEYLPTLALYYLFRPTLVTCNVAVANQPSPRTHFFSIRPFSSQWLLCHLSSFATVLTEAHLSTNRQPSPFANRRGRKKKKLEVRH